MTKTVDVTEAQNQLKELLSQALAGVEVILTEDNTPIARLVPIVPNSPRVPGLHAGAIWASEDFDAPLPDEFWMGKA